MGTLSNEAFLIELDDLCSGYPDFKSLQTKSLVPRNLARIYLLDVRRRHKADEKPLPYLEVLGGLIQEGHFSSASDDDVEVLLEKLAADMSKETKSGPERALF
jgi:hypothetical protein